MSYAYERNAGKPSRTEDGDENKLSHFGSSGGPDQTHSVALAYSPDRPRGVGGSGTNDGTNVSQGGG